VSRILPACSLGFVARLGDRDAERHTVLQPEGEEIAMTHEQSGQAVTILVAEDNDVNQMVVEQILETTGHSFAIVGDGRKELEMYHQLKPRLVLMDVSMPDMNGLEATKAIREAERESGAHVPIIGLTAHALKGDREMCLEAGMDDYMSKPISPDKLTAKVEEWLGLSADRAGGQAVA
jgi:CheY-like chemotaxis protein